MCISFNTSLALGPYSCRPQVKEAISNYWDKEFPDGGYKRCAYSAFYREDGSYYYGITVEVECNYHNQTNQFSCALLENNTFCIIRIGPIPGFCEDGVIPVNSPYPTIYIPDEILGKKVTQIGMGCGKHEDYPRSTTEGLKDLHEVVLPETIEQINDEAFTVKTLGITTNPPFRINIPNSVKKIGERIFTRDASHSPQIEISITPEQPFFAVMQNALFDKSNRRLIAYLGAVEFDQIKQYDIPQGIHHIEPYSFIAGGHFSKIHVPSSVKRIGRKAFADCKIEQIIIEEGTEIIEQDAFMSFNKELRSVILPKSIREIGKNAFGYTPSATFTIVRDSYAAAWAIEQKKERQYTDAMDWLKE